MTLFISKLDPDVARIRELTDLLNQANDKYRRGERSGLTDTQFDKLLRELKTLEDKHPDAARDNSPTCRIGIEPLSGLVRVKHTTPMLSIENVYTLDELAKFLRKADAEFMRRTHREPQWMIEYKVDGAALALVYENGELVSARTRGDGVYGDDVLVNARTISGVPLTLNIPGCRLPQRVEIRGEAYMKNSAFRNWNATGKYANPRNATAGALRLLDPRECAKRPLSFMAHTAADLAAFAGNATTQSTFLYLMEKAGFATPRLMERWCTSAEVLEFCRTAYDEGSNVTDEVDFETDGLVIKLDDFSLREILGSTSSAPKWAIAYKVEKYEAMTVLNDVTWQMGKTGICAPVAELEPVVIAGTTVSRASLFNLDIIAELGLMIGDTVKVEKAGKIIPHIVSVESKGGNRRKIEPPKHCPSCRWELAILNGRNGEVLLGWEVNERSTVVRCENPSCPAQLADKIVFYASRDGIDIPGIGEQLAGAMVEARLVGDIADLYALTERQLMTLPRMGHGSAAKLVQAIQSRKTPPLEKFLHGLTIPNVGEGTSKRLAKHCRSLAVVAAASESELAAIVDIGPITARSIYHYFHSNHWNTMAKKFQENGVCPADLETTTSSQALNGLTIVVTGTLENYDRRTIEATIEAHGGKSSSSVSGRTSYVLVGEKPGSKLAKAQALGIPILNESQFNALINSV